MKAYTITSGLVQIGEGTRIRLTAEQAAARAHKLKPVEGETDIYDVTGLLEFKSGEVIGLDDSAYAQLGKAQGERISEEGADTLKQSGKDDEHGFNTRKRGAAAHKR